MPSSACCCAHRDLPSFPTRRSSDLGKGMRRVDRVADFDSSWRAAQSEALNAFGNDAVYLEKYLEEPHHVEIQVFADRSGNTVHLNERSEEHTSELQSLRHLVCRLLLAAARTVIYPLSLHDALPISARACAGWIGWRTSTPPGARRRARRSTPSATTPCIWRSTWRSRTTWRSRCSPTARGTPCTSTRDRKSTRLNSSHLGISYAVFCLLLRAP